MTKSTAWLRPVLRLVSAGSVCLTVALASAADPADPTTGEWKTFGNGPSHTGYYPASIGSASITAGWTKTFPLALNQVAVSGGRVFLTVNGYFSNSSIFAAALNAADGAELWRYPLPSSFSLNPPTYEAGQVFFQRCNHSNDTYLYALNSTTGALNWAAPHASQWERYMAPTVFGGGVWVNGGSYGGMYGFNTADGARRFFFSLPQEDEWTPTYHGGVVYSCVAGILKANDPRTGSDLWTRDLRPAGTTVYAGNVVAVLNDRAFVIVGQSLVGFDLLTRTVAWRVTGSFAGTPATDGTAVYALQGSAVKAYAVATGQLLGTYTASASLASQPLVLNDVVIAASANNTFLFDKSTYALRSTLPTGGFVSYSQGVIYTADSTGRLATYNVLLATPEPTPTPTPVPTPTPTPTPSATPTPTPLATPTPTPTPLPSPSPGASPTPTPPPNPAQPLWLDAKVANNTAYFLFAGTSPRIERYDLATETWVSAIPLSGTPTAFTADVSGIYVSFGRRTARVSLDGAIETHLVNTVADVSQSVLGGDYLYLAYGSSSSGNQFTSVNKATGTVLDAKNYSYSLRGLSIAPTKNKIFGRSTGVSPSDIVQIVTNPNGTLGAQTDSPSHGDYPSATRTFVFPNESKVADDSGIIYNTTDLTYVNSFGGAFTDLDFSGDRSVVLRNKTLIGYSNTFLETGRHPLAGTPLRIFVFGSSVFSFYQGDTRGVFAVETPLDALVPGTPGQPINPEGLAYTPDAIHLGNDGILYLLSRAHFSVFRWSVPERRYLTTIPLVEAPTYIAFSHVNNALYLGYPGGKLTRIKPAESLSEVPFANLPQSPRGLAAAGEYVFASDPSGAWNTHYVFGPEGSLRSQKDWNYYSTEYIWSAANRKMYFFRDDTSPNDIIWENIDLEGKIGTQQDSPYHDSAGILHPIRVAPDGSIVLLGSGRIYHAVTLQLVNSLSNNIADADWLKGRLFTVRDVSGNSEMQAWNSSYAVSASKVITGKPLRLLSVGERLVLVHQNSGKPGFTELDENLSTQFATPLPTPTPVPTPVPTPKPTATPTPSPSPAPSPSSSPSASPSPAASPSATASPSPAASPTPTATPAAAGTLLNLSTRMKVQTGDNVLIGGFIISGSQPKKVMVSVSGPSLQMSDTLQNPTLELHRPGDPILFNDNWRDAQEAEIIASTIPPEHDLEPAIIVTLPPGPCTAVVRGVGGTSGVGVVAIYDLDSGGTARLANISARGRVESGDNVMIGGFIVGDGARNARVVVRALGPSLAAAGIAESLQDPTLELHDANGNQAVTNDDWQSGSPHEIDALGLRLSDPRESAILATLPPGGYTAVVRGKGGTVGVGLVETYWIN